MIDREEDPHLAFTAVHGIVDSLVKAGNFGAAEYLLDASRPLYSMYAGDVDRVKLRWVEGKIAAGLGELGQGEQAFAEAREAFVKLGKPYAVALVTLGLAAVYLRQGRPTEVGRLATEMLATFRALGIRREAIAAVLLLEEAVQTGRLTLAFLQELTRQFQSLEA